VGGQTRKGKKIGIVRLHAGSTQAKEGEGGLFPMLYGDSEAQKKGTEAPSWVIM